MLCIFNSGIKLNRRGPGAPIPSRSPNSGSMNANPYHTKETQVNEVAPPLPPIIH